MQLLASCEFAAARGRVPAAWSCQRPVLPAASTRKQRPAVTKRCAASGRDDGRGGRTVDEGMAVLRRRIHELRAAEDGWEPPAHEWTWTAWEQESERRAAYDAEADVVVCGLVGALQALLMSERPGVGVGVLAALALTVPASAFVLVSHLIDASRGILSSLPH